MCRLRTEGWNTSVYALAQTSLFSRALGDGPRHRPLLCSKISNRATTCGRASGPTVPVPTEGGYNFPHATQGWPGGDDMQGTDPSIDMTVRDLVRGVRLAGVLALLVVLLSGCAELSELPVTESGSETAATEQAFSHARVMELLHEGRAEQAATMLRTRLEAEPGDNGARQLLSQIESPPAELLGDASFQYEVQPGESLSVLAQRFLGNYRLFFALARYNDITNPSMLQAGQTIRVPSDYWDGPEPSREPLDREIRARELLANGQPREAMRLYEDVEPDTLGQDELALLGTAHRRWIARALNDGDYGTARARLVHARRQAPGDNSWENWLAGMERRAVAEPAYRAGMAQRERDPVAAASSFKRALEADPGHVRARDALAALRTETVPELHRRAVILYRNQQLEEAIELWEQALSIDPDFQPAQGYRARADELRRRLETLE